MRYFIDTNIFLRVLTKDVKGVSQDCIEALEAIRRGKIEAFTSSLVLCEIGWTLSTYYDFPKKKIVKALKGVVSLKNLDIIDSFDPWTAIGLFEDQPIKLIDGFIASNLQIEEDVTILSFDKDFDQLNTKRIEPKELLRSISSAG